MTRSIAALLVLTSTLGAGRAVAQGVAPSITLGGQPSSLAPPVAILDSDTQRVSILFASAPLPAAVEAAGRKAGAWDLTKTGPAVLVELDFTPGSTLPEEVTRCRLTATGFKAPLTLAGAPDACHVQSLIGTVAPGGLLMGLLDGKGPAYALHLPFTAAFRDAKGAATAGPALGGASAAAITGVPVGTVSGSAAYIGQTQVFSNGLAWWDGAKRSVKVLFFDHPPRAGTLDAIRSGAMPGDAPTMTLDLRFDSSAAPDMTAVEACGLTLTFPKGGPIAAASDAEGCGISRVSAYPRAGGTVSAVLAGSARGPVADYTWDVRFNLPIAK